VMFAGLLAFLEERDVSRIARFLGSLSVWEGVRASPGISDALTSALSQGERENFTTFRNAGWHLLAAGVFVAAGFSVQYGCDWYGVLGRQSLAHLTELPVADFVEMLAERPLAWEDYFHRVELGSRFGGNQVFG